MNGENVNFVITPEFWSIVASVVSVILGLLAIGLSIWFFVVNRGTEKNVSNSLTKIETQANVLQKITGKQLDRYTKYFTEEKPATYEPFIPKLIEALINLPETLITQSQQLPSSQITKEMTKTLIMFYISTYFYTTQTNFWIQPYLPNAQDFDPQNPHHISIKRIVEMSAADCHTVAEILDNCNPQELADNPLSTYLFETRDIWKDFVRTCSQIYESRAKEQ